MKSVSSTLSILLLVFITIASVVFMYVFITNYMNTSEPHPSELVSSLLKIDGVKIVETGDGFALIYVWIRNVGKTEVKVNGLYVVVQGSCMSAKLAYTISDSPIWGGDVWEFKRETQTIVRIEDGLIFYEDFRDGYSNEDWVFIDTLESSQGEWGSAIIDSVNGLILTISREGTRGTEKYGLRTKNPFSIPDGIFVAEFNTTKLSGINGNYMVEVYFSQYNTTDNPYYLTEFALMFISGWNPDKNYYSNATIVKRTRNYIWSYSFSGNEVSGLWVIISDRIEGKIHVYYYGDNYNGYVDYLFGFSDELYTQPYIYLDVGVWSGESGTFSVSFPWFKIYRNLSFVIKGLNDTWRILLIDNNGKIIGDKTVPPGEESVSFHRINDNIAYPLNADIVVIPSDNGASNIGYVINPGEVRVITGLIEEPLPSAFKIRIVTSEGVETVYEVRRR